MVQMLKSRTQTTKLHKVRAHANIDGNEQDVTLTKIGYKIKNNLSYNLKN